MILVKFLRIFFAEHVLATTFHMMLFFPFCRSVRFAAQFIRCCKSKLGERIPKPVHSGVDMEIRWKLYCQVVATHVPA